MGMQDVPRCQHLKVNGVQCGSPALRRRRKCYFHEGLRLDDEKFLADQFGNRRFVMPVLEDANAIQVGLMKVIQFLADGRMEPKVAGLMLYALQTAASNLRNTNFEATKPTDVVIDRKDVDRTCLNGPQWYARDFAPAQATQAPEKPEEAGDAAAASTETKAAQPRPRKLPEAVPQEEARPCETCRTMGRTAKPRRNAGKTEREVMAEQGATLLRDFYYKMFPDEAPTQSVMASAVEAGAG